MMSLGIKSFATEGVHDRVIGFTMVSWIHDGLLDSRWIPEFTMGSWIRIHDEFVDSSLDSTSLLCTGPRVR